MDRSFPASGPVVTIWQASPVATKLSAPLPLPPVAARAICSPKTPAFLDVIDRAACVALAMVKLRETFVAASTSGVPAWEAVTVHEPAPVIVTMPLATVQGPVVAKDSGS